MEQRQRCVGLINEFMSVTPTKLPIHQRGVAVLLLVVTLLLGAAAIFYGLSTATPPQIERDRKTAQALLIAKAALLSYAVSVNISTTSTNSLRLGDLPCPDNTDSGSANTAGCGNSAGTTGQTSRIGRLPWKDLGLEDLRDGDGERLWYAVSNNFKEFTRTACNATFPTTCLNSDTRGTITIRDNAGNIIHDAINTDPSASGVIAVVFSPGAMLTRQDGVQLSRGCGGDGTCATTGVCSNTATPRCNPVNYLDTSGTEDNANFSDVSAAPSQNGFIQGIVRDASGKVIVNDKLAVITYKELMPMLEKRVVAEVVNCLKLYAGANNGRYPWAVPVSDITSPHIDIVNTVFGRIPDNSLAQTPYGVATPTPPLIDACAATPNMCMSPKWFSSSPGVAGCLLPNTPSGTSWWNNWRQHVFYGVADAYKPLISFTQPTPTTVVLGGIPTPSGCPSCLTITPNATADKQFVVILAGKRLASQSRTTTAEKRNVTNYLEDENNNNDSIFAKKTSSSTFNDIVSSVPP